LIADAEVGDVLRGLGEQRVRVRSPRADDLYAALLAEGARVADGDPAGTALHVDRTAPGELEVTGLAAGTIGDLAHARGIPLHHLAEAEQSLEHAYLTLTEDRVEYHGAHPEPVAS
jgi:ABC-2 type transport system ATP-binding protein